MSNYHDIDGAISNSMLSDFRTSPALYEAYYVRPPELRLPRPESTKAKRIGITAHALLWQPEEFTKEIVVAPKVDKRTTDGKRIYANFVLGVQGRMVIDPEELEVAQRCKEAVLNNKIALALIESEGPCEESIRWEHSSGLQLKAKIDKQIVVVDSVTDIVDLKTTDDPTPEAYGRSAYDYEVGRQMFHYMDGVAFANSQSVSTIRAHIIAVRNKEPFDVFVYRLPAKWIEVGSNQRNTTLDSINEAIRTGVWLDPAQLAESDLIAPYWAREYK